MTEEELAAFAVWLRQSQGVDMEPAELREPAATTVKLGALVGAAAADLPFGAEPSGFHIATAKLAGDQGVGQGAGQGADEQGGDGDAG